MGLRDIEATLPPGFRFYPSDEELVCHYLRNKIVKEELLKGTLVDIDLHTCEPWQLPEVAKVKSREWYFFSIRDRKYATGIRTNRATISGYWKATGKDRMVFDPSSGVIAGLRKTLVFYRNRAPSGIKTGWIMHEFRLHTHLPPPKEDWVLCRVFHKSKGEEENKFMDEEHEDSLTTSITTTAAAQATHIAASNHYGFSHQQYYQISSNDKSGISSGVEEEVGGGTSNGDCEDFGFFWDLSFDQSNGVIPSAAVEIMRFHDDDNHNTIFL